MNMKLSIHLVAMLLIWHTAHSGAFVPGSGGLVSGSGGVTPTSGDSMPAIDQSGSLNSMTQDVSFSQTLTATGGNLPLTWTVNSGSLPAGLSLSTGGAITGTPTTASSGSVTIQVSDNDSDTDQETFSWTVASPSGGQTNYSQPFGDWDATGWGYNTNTKMANLLSQWAVLKAVDLSGVAHDGGIPSIATQTKSDTADRYWVIDYASGNDGTGASSTSSAVAAAATAFQTIKACFDNVNATYNASRNETAIIYLRGTSTHLVPSGGYIDNVSQNNTQDWFTGPKLEPTNGGTLNWLKITTYPGDSRALVQRDETASGAHVPAATAALQMSGGLAAETYQNWINDHNGGLDANPYVCEDMMRIGGAHIQIVGIDFDGKRDAIDYYNGDQAPWPWSQGGGTINFQGPNDAGLGCSILDCKLGWNVSWGIKGSSSSSTKSLWLVVDGVLVHDTDFGWNDHSSYAGDKILFRRCIFLNVKGYNVHGYMDANQSQADFNNMTGMEAYYNIFACATSNVIMTAKNSFFVHNWVFNNNSSVNGSAGDSGSEVLLYDGRTAFATIANNVFWRTANHTNTVTSGNDIVRGPSYNYPNGNETRALYNVTLRNNVFEDGNVTSRGVDSFGSIPTWYSGILVKSGSLVAHNGNVYVCRGDSGNHTSSSAPPTTDSGISSWRLVGTVAGASHSISGNIYNATATDDWIDPADLDMALLPGSTRDTGGYDVGFGTHIGFDGDSETAGIQP